MLLRGPWKLYAMILTLAFITTTQLMLPSPPASTTGSCPLHTATANNTTPDNYQQTDRNGSLISRQCLQALLLMSGVEQNPGPDALTTENDHYYQELFPLVSSHSATHAPSIHPPILEVHRTPVSQLTLASPSPLIVTLTTR